MKKILVIDDSALMRRNVSDIIEKTKIFSVDFYAKNEVEAIEILKSNDEIVGVVFNSDLRRNTEEFMAIAFNKCPEMFIVFWGKSDFSKSFGLFSGNKIVVMSPYTRISAYSNQFEVDLLKIFDRFRDDYERKNVTIEKNDMKNIIFSKNSNSVNNEKRKRKGLKRLVAIVSSTGGPKALQSVIPKLPSNLAAPVVVVQHMPQNFTKTLADRLNETSKLKVKEAEDKEKLNIGNVYIAKGGEHLTIKNINTSNVIMFDETPAVGGLKPCGNLMYNSLCDSDYDQIICVVLTGMGEDGTDGIELLSKSKDVFVIAQDQNSSTVYGMPKAVYERGLVDIVCDLQDVSENIIKKVGVL